MALVTLTLRIPDHPEQQVQEAAQETPEFLGRVLVYGLTRRTLYRYLQDGVTGSPKDPLHS